VRTVVGATGGRTAARAAGARGSLMTQRWTLGRIKTIWSLLKRAMADFAAADLDGLVRIVKCTLKKIQYRSRLMDGCLAGTGL
jgi:hypothetical protein